MSTVLLQVKLGSSPMPSLCIIPGRKDVQVKHTIPLQLSIQLKNTYSSVVGIFLDFRCSLPDLIVCSQPDPLWNGAVHFRTMSQGSLQPK